MNRLFPLVFVLTLISCSLTAQNKQYRSSADSDAEAKRLLDAIRTKYDAYENVVADFSLVLSFPGGQPITQIGSVTRMGERVRFKLGDQEGIVNETAAYIIQHANKEVMINNLPEPGDLNGVLTPQTLFSFYEGDNYILASDGTETRGGRELSAILLKPADRDASEFTKMRVLVDAARKEIVSVQAFSRDGSRYTFALKNVRGNAVVSNSLFVFDKADFPGYHVEDLRY